MNKFFGEKLRFGNLRRMALTCAVALFSLSLLGKTEFSIGLNDYFETVSAPAASGADGNPARVVVTDNLIFVLEQYTHRIAVYDRTNPGVLIHYYGAVKMRTGEGVVYTNSTATFSSGNGGFNKPFGLALSPIESKLVVADEGNNRVQLFSFDSATGSITFEKSATGFSKPKAVSFSDDGTKIFVADSGASRIVSLSSTTLAEEASLALTDDEMVKGLCYDNDGEDGVWIADSQNNRVAYYHLSSSSPVVTYRGELEDPRDVQIINFGGYKYLSIVDSQNSCVRLLKIKSLGGKNSALAPISDIGAPADSSLEPYEQLWYPNGVFPVPGTSTVYVADYGHNMVKWYDLSIDPADAAPAFVSATAVPSEVTFGESVAITATFDEDLGGAANVELFDTTAQPFTNLAMSIAYNTATVTYDVSTTVTGVIDSVFTFTGGLPQEEVDGLFEIVPPAKLVSATASQTEVVIGSSVTITAIFDRELKGDATIDFVCSSTNIPGGTMVVSGNSATYVFTAADTNLLGAVDAKITYTNGGDSPTLFAGLFSIVDKPVEEYVETGWAISAIKVNASTVVLGWAMPTAAMPSDGGALQFQVEHRASLTTGDWSPIGSPVELAQSAAGGSVAFDLMVAPISNGAMGFFRLIWKNKVK